jgi:hypothetical protein
LNLSWFHLCSLSDSPIPPRRNRWSSASSSLLAELGG